MEALADRPPYVTFENRPIEDREASIRCGHIVYKDVPFAFITPAGSRDRIEKQADRWLEDKQRDVDAQRMPAEWLRGFHAKYEAWKAGQEMPVDGTSLSSWGLLTPAQMQNLKNMGFRTIEDVAAANAEGLSRIGMGALDMKQRAIDWLKAAEKNGVSAAEMDKLRNDLKAALSRLEQVEASNKALEAELAAREHGGAEPRRRGRPPKQDQEIDLEL